MKDLVICKSCGFIMAKSDLQDKCPACGVPARMFEPYVERMSPSRKRILQLDLHPILVHFTQAFTATIPVLCLLALVGPARIQPQLLSTIAVLGVALPVVVLWTFLAGLLDGKIRFRRVTTPLLKRKLLFGAALFLFSCGILLAIVLRRQMDTIAIADVLALSLPAVGCSSYLGLLGVRLSNSAFPG
jgi:hypothetical protein